jgi:serine/threonine-protein kinase RsbW
MPADKSTLRLANSLEEIVAAAEAVEEFCAGHGVPMDALFKINVAVEEILTNIVRHGFSDSDRHEILLTIATEPGQVVVEVSDDGMAFNPLEAPEPDLSTDLMERKIGGLGIHFVRTMMDGVDYRRENGRNHLTVRKEYGSEAG